MTVSVVVPTRDRPAPLAACLAALARLTPPAGGFEVIVVDDGNGTEPVAVAAPSPASWAELRLLRSGGRGPAAARNAGAAAAGGELLAFTDDDCLPDPAWLIELLDCARAQGADVVGGRIVNALPDDPWAGASHALLERLYHWYNADPADARFLASSNFAVRASVFASIHGFDATFPTAAGEDRDLCARLRESGVRMAYEPSAVVRHAHPLGLAGFWRQHLAYGRGAARFHHLRARRTKEHVQLEPPSFYRRLLRGDPRVSGRIVLAQLAIALGAALEWRRARRR